MAESQFDREKRWTEIEQYLLDQMSVAERSDFEQRLQSDPSLQSELNLHATVHNTLGNSGEYAFRKTLQRTAANWHQSHVPSKVRAIRPIWIIMSVAASLLLVVVAYTWFGNTGTGDVFAQHFEAYPMVLTQRTLTDTSATNRLLTEAITTYQAGDLQTAAGMFEQLRTAGMDEVTIQFYEAVSLLGSGDPLRAAERFRKVLEKNDHLLVEQSRWYLGLALLQAGEMEQAKEVFRSIKPSEYNHARVKATMASMKN